MNGSVFHATDCASLDRLPDPGPEGEGTFDERGWYRPLCDCGAPFVPVRFLRPGVVWVNKHNGDETTITGFASRVERVPSALGGFKDDPQLVVQHTADAPPGFPSGYGTDALSFVEHWEPRRV